MAAPSEGSSMSTISVASASSCFVSRCTLTAWMVSLSRNSKMWGMILDALSWQMASLAERQSSYVRRRRLGDGLREGDDLQPGLRDDPEGPLAPHHEVDEVEPGPVLGERLPEVGDLAVGEDDPQGDHPVLHGPVLHAAQPPRALRDRARRPCRASCSRGREGRRSRPSRGACSGPRG